MFAIDPPSLSKTDTLLGRSSAGGGTAEEIDCTAAGRAILDDANATAQRATLGLGDAATKNVGTTAGTVAAGDDARLGTPPGTFEGYVQVDTTTQISLQRDKGKVCVVASEVVDPGASGIACDAADNLIASDGTDSGNGPSTSTLYNLYLSNSLASFAPSDLRLCATAPTLVNGVPYLAATGNGANWRYVGKVYVDGAGHFQDNESARNLGNYYNRRAKAIELCPGYVDDNATTSYSLNSGSYVSLNGGTGSVATYVDLGEDAAFFDLTVSAYPTTGGITAGSYFGIDVDGVIDGTTYAYALTSQNVMNFKTSRRVAPSAGLRTVTMKGANTVGALSVIADTDRKGQAADPRCTYMVGVVML